MAGEVCSQHFALTHLDKYDLEIHSLLGEIVGARVVLAALSPGMHDLLSPLIDRLYDLDVHMGEAKRTFEEDRAKGSSFSRSFTPRRETWTISFSRKSLRWE